MQINYYGPQLGCGCRGSCKCFIPPISNVQKPLPQRRFDIDTLTNMIVATIGCGSTDLTEYLRKYVPLIIRRNGYCQDELLFIGAQVESLDLAMQFVAGLVDYSDSRSQSKSLQTSRSRTTTEAKAQATSNSISCGYSDASSFNQFVRDSYDRARSQSTTDSESQGRSDSHTWDRSKQEAQELSQVWDTSRSTSDGEGEGQHFESTSSSGASYSRTNQLPSILYNNIDISNKPFGEVGQFFSGLWNSITNRTLAGRYTWNRFGGTFNFDYDDTERPAFTGFRDLTDIFQDDIDQSYVDSGGQIPQGDQIPDQYCCCDNLILGPVGECIEPGDFNCHWKNEVPLPTEGEFYSVTWKLSVGLEFLKSGLKFNVDWGRGGDWNRSHVITKACTSSTGQSQTTNFYNQIDWSRAHGETLTTQDSYTQRDLHTRADSERTAHSRTDAGSANTGDAEGKSESGAERAAHNESRGSSQGTNWSKSRGRANSLTTSDSESRSIAENLSDIFQALSKMRDILFDERNRYLRIFGAMQGASIAPLEDCCYAIPADPVNQARLRSLHAKWNQVVKPTYRQPTPASEAGISCIGV